MSTANEAAWRRRFRAARVSLPSWARDEPSRLLYASNASGTWELSTWDLKSGSHRQATNRPEGTLRGQLNRAGDTLWWFDDDRGNEFGRWVTEPFAGGERAIAVPELPPAYGAGLATGGTFAVLGSSSDEGSSIHIVRNGEAPRLLYRHEQSAWVDGI